MPLDDKQRDLEAKYTGLSGMSRELGAASDINLGDEINADEFLDELRGLRGIKKYREMRENDPIVGAILFSLDMMIKSIGWKFKPPHALKDDPEAVRLADFMQTVFDDMQFTKEEFISEVLTFLPYGFSLFEVVWKRRRKGNSEFPDGFIGIHKLAPRAQWSVDRFDMTPEGDMKGVFQYAWGAQKGQVYIPKNKLVHFRTTLSNNDPSGRSILRNAYISYYYVSHIEKIEAIAIERELNGLPVARVPAAYLSSSATADQAALVANLKKAMMNVKRNEQGYLILPSDLWMGESGPTSKYLLDFELAASKGTRDIDTTKVVTRHGNNIARTTLADFLMLGQSERGSFALSKSKTELYLQSILGYTTNIAATVKRQITAPLLKANGMDVSKAPNWTPDDLSSRRDLRELGMFIDRVFRATGKTIDGEAREELYTYAGLTPPSESEGEEVQNAPDV